MELHVTLPSGLPMHQLLEVLRSLGRHHDEQAVTKQDLHELEKRLMATIQETLDLARANTTVLGSLNTMLDGVRDRVNEILRTGGVTPEIQGQIDSLFSELTNQKNELDAVVTENTGLGNPPTTPQQAQARRPAR